MTGARETGYNTELQETFYTEEVANHFYENIALLHYNLKEIEFIPFELLTSYETPRHQEGGERSFAPPLLPDGWLFHN